MVRARSRRLLSLCSGGRLGGLSNYIAILAQLCARFRIERCSGCATVLGMRHDALRPREREWRKR